MSTIGIRGETRVNTALTDDQWDPSVVCLSDGGWIVTWTTDDKAIYQQRYAVSGLAIGNETLVSTKSGFQSEPCVTPLKDGGWLVTWTGMGHAGDVSGVGILQQRYAANGTKIGPEALVNTFTNGSQLLSSVTSLADGGWIVTWTSLSQDGSQAGVYQQRYNADGVAQNNEIRVNTHTAGEQSRPSVTALVDGGWVVTWESKDQDGSGNGIYQQRYSTNGQIVGNEKQVNSSTDGDQSSAKTIALAGGGWVVTWRGASPESSNAIYQQRFSAGGAAIDGETRVNTAPLTGGTNLPQVTALSDGGWIVTWQSIATATDVYSIHQQRYAASGQAIGSEILVKSLVYSLASEYRGTSVTALNDGGWLVTWQADDGDHGFDIYQQRFAADGQKIGPTTPTGLSLAQAVAEGRSGLTVQLATKALVADGNHTYTLLDDAGGRFALSSSGALVVKDGIRLDYEQARSHAIKVQVKDGLGASHEQWLEVAVADMARENLTGSAAADVLKGGRFKDTFNGAAGHDRLWGGLGNDVLKGSTGRDIFVFDSKPSKSSNRDKIVDFKVKDDTFWLDNAVFTKLGRKGSEASPSKLNKSYFALEEAKDRNDYIVYSKQKGVLYYDADGSGRGKAVEVATLTKNLKMTYTDFYVI